MMPFMYGSWLKMTPAKKALTDLSTPLGCLLWGATKHPPNLIRVKYDVLLKNVMGLVGMSLSLLRGHFCAERGALKPNMNYKPLLEVLNHPISLSFIFFFNFICVVS